MNELKKTSRVLNSFHRSNITASKATTLQGVLAVAQWVKNLTVVALVTAEAWVRSWPSTAG